MSNVPDSQNDVITTVTHALLRFEDLVMAEMPNIPLVYTEDLSHESAMKQMLADDNYSGANITALPYFAYNRTVLLPIEDKGLGRRAKNCVNTLRIGDEVLKYSTAYAETDIQFMYVSDNIELTEKFEVVYNSDEGISGTKELIVPMDVLGDFKYYLEYGDLTEIQIEFNDMYYKALLGSIKMRGFYFTFTGKSGLIKEIRQRIITSNDIPNKVELEILSDVTIV